MSRIDALRAELAEAMADVREAIRQHGQDLLNLPGVVAVRPGYRFRDGRITDDPAVVVSVEQKSGEDDVAPEDRVPRTLGDVVVDVVQANPLEQYRMQQDSLAGPPTGARAQWRVSTALPGETDIDPSDTEGEELAGPPTPLVPYVPPDEPAVEVDEEMTVICHASCDRGFPMLHGFFDRTQRSLVSTMYEFTASHVLNALLPNLEDPVTFTFIFDGKNKRLSGDDLRPAVVLDALQDAAGDRMTFAWAANRQSRVVSEGFFPTAYHIKVSVRDGEEVWLSSGNWKSSGQPAEDPFNPPDGFNATSFQRQHNREWHVLIQNDNLAEQFARYINHDVTQALPLQLDTAGPEVEEMPDLWVPVAPVDPEAGPAVFPFVEPLEVSGRIRALPLFTPDTGSYFDFVVEALANAKHKVWLENQSLSPRLNDTAFMNDLILVLAGLTHRDDVDVRIIVRDDFDPWQIQEKLQASNFNLDCVKYLSNVHTKGLIVDDEYVVIGSHNWTSQGVGANRDASIVFWDERIIGYYNDLFDRDWNRADDTPGPGARLAGPAMTPAPAGFARVPWSAVVED